MRRRYAGASIFFVLSSTICRVQTFSSPQITVSSTHTVLLTEGDKLGKDAISGKVYEIGRRYVLAEPSAAAEYLVPVQLDGEIVGTPVKGYTPFDSTRIRISGGGENYVHGGISLQEFVVPVISFKKSALHE